MNKEIMEMAEVIRKARQELRSGLILPEETATALHNAGYRKQSDTVKEFANHLLIRIDKGIKDIKKHPYDSREETELFIRALECVRMDTENIAAEFGVEEDK